MYDGGSDSTFRHFREPELFRKKKIIICLLCDKFVYYDEMFLFRLIEPIFPPKNFLEKKPQIESEPYLFIIILPREFATMGVVLYWLILGWRCFVRSHNSWWSFEFRLPSTNWRLDSQEFLEQKYARKTMQRIANSSGLVLIKFQMCGMCAQFIWSQSRPNYPYGGTTNRAL